ncbi:MAG: DUF5665 domain-containing protein [Candidatus Peregrinibacteria bacterium]|nr:DUF5665 domain-containing protein [Candidatus Peregrinibacteria bacterium]
MIPKKNTRPTVPQAEAKLVASLETLRRTFEEVPREYEYFLHPGKHLFFTFLKGIVSGLGVIAAVAIVIPIMLAMMHGIEWVPLIGDFVTRIADRVEQSQRP